MKNFRDTVKKGVEDWLAQSPDRSRNQIANLSKGKVSGATLTNLLEKETNISQNKLLAIARVINLNLNEQVHWQFSPEKGFMDNYTAIEQMVTVAGSQKLDFWIDGPSGSGKTYAFEQIKAGNTGKTDKVQLAYIELKEGMKSAFICQQLLKEYLSRKAFNELPKNAGQLRQKLADVLIDKVDVLVMDQVEFAMTASKLKFLHGLWDLLQGKVGMVFCGAHTLDTLVKKGIHQNKNFFNQMATRFEEGFRVLEGISETYIRKACEHEGITDESAMNWFAYHCKHFRTFTPKIQKSLSFARANNLNPSELTEKILNKINTRSIQSAKTLGLCD